MNKKNIIIILFIIFALIQIYFPVKIIFDRENIIKGGDRLRFKISNISKFNSLNNDYLMLNFENNNFEVPKNSKWSNGDNIYVFFKNDEKNFSKISSVSKKLSKHNNTYIKAKVDYLYNNDTTNMLYIKYPFEKFYNKGNKISVSKFISESEDKNKKSIYFGIVYVKNGESVLISVKK